MHNKFFLIILLFLGSLFYSQDYEILYKVDFRPQKSSLTSFKTEYMVLQSKQTASFFFNPNLLKKDNFKNNETSEKPYLKFSILKSGQSSTYIGSFNGLNFKLKETIPLKWKITDYTTTYKNYKVQKAYIEFENRKWYAYFAPEVPILNGPYKFYGLPGLILLVCSDDGDYSFEMVEISKQKKYDASKILNSQSALIKRNDLDKMISEFVKDPGSHNFRIMINENDSFDYQFDGEKGDAYKDMNKYVNDLLSRYDNPIDKKTFILVY